MPSEGWTSKARRALAKYTHYHVTTFFLTFFSYACFHANRKTFSNVKTTLVAEWTPSFPPDNKTAFTPRHVWGEVGFFSTHDEAQTFMGTLDACFMFSYAAGLFVSGFVADRNDMRLVLSVGMGLTSLTIFLFGCVFGWLQLNSQPAYIVVWVINGFLQSTGWPCVVAVMGNWFGKGSRGLVMGLWSACASVGNIMGALLVAAVLDYGYEYAFLVTTSVLLACALLNFVGLVPSPLDVGLPLPEEEQEYGMDFEVEIPNPSDDSGKAGTNGLQLDKLNSGYQDDNDGTFTPSLTISRLEDHADKEKDNGVHKDTATPASSAACSAAEDAHPKAINFFTALRLPGVVPYALCYAFLKLVNYSFFFWLPFYLSSAYDMAETDADKLSIWYDIGGIVGGTVAGLVSDWLQVRSVVVVPMLLTAVPVLLVYGLSGVASTVFSNGLLLFLLGCLIGGVANLISAAISADLGRQKALKGNAEALSTVTGILDGTGSLGAALGQLAVPYLQIAVGWRSVFYMFMVCTLLTALCLAKIFYQETRRLCLRSRLCCSTSGTVSEQ